MASKDFYLDYDGTKLLWDRIVDLCDKKAGSLKSADDSIQIKDRKISVKISKAAGNLLRLNQGEGLYVPSPHKLTFGADQQYVYDGSEDVTVPVYMGDYE